MNFNGFQYDIEATITFEREEYETLIELAKMHYDATCREAGYKAGELDRYNVPAAKNGFLAQLELFPDTQEGTGMLFNGKPAVKLDVSTATWSFRNLDLTMKILEQRDMLTWGKGEEGQKKLAICDRVAHDILVIMRRIKTEYERIQKPDVKPPTKSS